MKVYQNFLIINEKLRLEQLTQFRMSYQQYLSSDISMDAVMRAAYEVKRKTLLDLGIATEYELNTVEANVFADQKRMLRVQKQHLRYEMGK